MKKIKTILITIVLLWLAAFLLSKSFSTFSGDKIVSEGIAIIEIHGPLSIQGSSSIIQPVASSERILEDIDKAEKNSGIKAIILDINSGGGEPVASREIATAVKNSKKPVVAWIREVGASGAYWIASASDVIVADPLSVTGSVGVLASYIDFSDFLKKYDIQYQKLTGGEFKDTGSPFKDLTPGERNILQGKIDLVHEIFLDDVALNRNLTKEQLSEISSGIFYFGVEAKKLNLVDDLGGRDLAIEYAKRLSNVKNGNLVQYKQKKSVLDFLGSFSSQLFFAMGQGIGSELKLEEGLQIKT